VIDDLADTPHVADLLLDQNFFPDPARRYAKRVPRMTRTLFGPAYALIDPAFAAARRPDRPVRAAPPYRIVVSFGGGDDRGAAVKTLAALARLRRADLSVALVAGGANPRRDEIVAAAKGMEGVAVFDAVDDMVSLLADADLAVGAGGVSTWERFCLGVPTLALTIAPVQKPHLRALAAEEFLQWEGEAAQIAPAALADAIVDLLDDAPARRRLRERTMGLVDGEGARRVARALLDAP
ncbi:MAG: UDP-2,4-diacetamido-2,4,6-trideoxy-beta-L-altropyranose hydrolase, partial [Nitrospinae bacterium]|nr:UDP-2,4-diacetamido-2,4,6-trideoxy-beta-L-altropyranose hydrolase [Nitrospinota bacterium]